MLRDKRLQPLLFEALLFIISYLLLLEWIYPIGKVADLTGIPVLIMFTGWCFLISFIPMPWWIGMALKGAGLLLAVQEICFDVPFLNGSWFGQLISELVFNLKVLFSGNWQDLTELFRIVLILVLIWLMSYLLHYWFVLMKRVLLFIAATIMYVAVLSTFLDYDATATMIRIFAISFIALSLANIMKTVDREVVAFPTGKQMSKAIGVLISFMVIALLVGVVSPSFKPQWADPVPHVQQFAEETLGINTGSTSRRSGYDEDDTKLGGSFVQDYTPLFKTFVKTENYWRIETKDFYTGQGWKRSEAKPLELQDSGMIDIDDVGQKNSEYVSHSGKIEFEEGKKFDKLLYPYGVQRAYATDTSFYLEPISEAVHIVQAKNKESASSYDIEYDYPTYDIDKLRKDSKKDPEAIQTLYTQLPEGLPVRVDKLAEKIIKDEQNRFDQVKAIEQYFHQNGFQYETANVPIPSPKQDYVDQFLFDSKIGYCDNYSTSMVVMLRTQGIPARWAKGFTSGNMVGQEEIDKYTYDVYEVTNANAHSWVEVYFPDAGWVPFEPTQGFSNPSNFEQRAIDQPSINDKKDEQLKKEEKEKPVPQHKAEEKKLLKSDEDKQLKPREESGTEHNTMLYIIGLVIVILLAVAIVVYRKRWQIKATQIRKKLHNGNSNAEENAYRYVLELLASKGLPKANGETMREYAERVKSIGVYDEMTELTRLYEQQIYSGQLQKTSNQEFISCWERLINRLLA